MVFQFTSYPYYLNAEAEMKRELERKEQEKKRSPKVEFITGGVQPPISASIPKIPGIVNMKQSYFFFLEYWMEHSLHLCGFIILMFVIYTQLWLVSVHYRYLQKVCRKRLDQTRSQNGIRCLINHSRHLSLFRILIFRVDFCFAFICYLLGWWWC
jgi:hypothetical protein